MSNDVIQAVGVFFSYAVLAIFAQNAVFTRGLGVSRLVQLVGDERTSSGWFALLLTQSFTLEQSMGFGLGSGLGYLLAVMLVTEADHRLRSEAIPEAFRGLPITLVYVGVLALAIYGFTGHSVIL